MGERIGVGLVELAILESLDELGAGPSGRYARCQKVLTAVEDKIGLAPGYGYEVLIDLAVSWKLPIRLIDAQGNFGSRSDPPSSPRHSEARLSLAGQVALAAERGELAPVPIGLINGSTHRLGTRPPYRPAAIIEAIREIRRHPKLTTAQIEGIVGPPYFITGCPVTGDLGALAAGQRTELELRPRVTVTDAAQVNARAAQAAIQGSDEPFPPGADFPVVVLDRFPPYADPYEIFQQIGDRARMYAWEDPEIADEDVLPIAEATDLSSWTDDWQVYVPAAGTSAEEVRDRILKVHEVTCHLPVALPMPLAGLIRTWTRTHQHEDLETSLAALETALA